MASIDLRDLLAPLEREVKGLRQLVAQRDALLEALWVCMEHNRLHHGDSHNTVIQARAAIKQAEGEKT